MSLLSDLLRTCAIFKDDVAKPFREERLCQQAKRQVWLSWNLRKIKISFHPAIKLRLLQCTSLQSQTLKEWSLDSQSKCYNCCNYRSLHQFAHANMQPIIICKRSSQLMETKMWIKRVAQPAFLNLWVAWYWADSSMQLTLLRYAKGSNHKECLRLHLLLKWRSKSSVSPHLNSVLQSTLLLTFENLDEAVGIIYH